MKYKKIFLSLITLVFIPCLITISTAWLYPMERIDVTFKEVLLQDYEDYYGYALPKNSKTENVFEDPQKYLIIDYTFKLKNNTSKTLFIEDYSLDTLGYNIVYFKDSMDFYSYYEYNPNEESKCFGQAIIYIGDTNKQKVLNELTDSMRLNVWYWVYYNDFISLLTFSKI